MKTTYRLVLMALLPFNLLAAAQVVPVGSAFTYQGQLRQAGAPANGTFDLQFRLFTHPTLGFIVGSPVVIDDVSIVDGYFTVKLDFGAAAFPGTGRFVEIGVRQGASLGTFTLLSGRQELTPAPYATALALPYAASHTAPGPLFSMTQSGTGGVMSLTGSTADVLKVSSTTGDAVEATSSGGNAINAISSGPGAAVRGAGSGTGSGVYGQSTGGGAALYGYNLGTSGHAGFFRTEGSNNTSAAINSQSNGTGPGIYATSRAGRSAFFENTNTSGINGGLLSTVAGGGIPIWGKTTGTSAAARFDIDSSTSTANALEVNNAGTGLTAKFNGGDVQVNGNLYARTGTVLNRATPIAWGTFETFGQNPSITTSSGNVMVSFVSGYGWRVQVVGEGEPSKWTVIATPRYGSNPAASNLEMTLKVGSPLSVIGQSGTGAFYISERCTNGCNEFVPPHWINFVVYRGQ